MSAIPSSVKAKVSKIKTSLDEARFLTSNSYRIFLEKIVRGISGNYSLKLIFSEGVYTDGNVVSVNPLHPYLTNLKDLSEKTLCILGQLAHEVFHILYTDFRTLEEIEKRYKQQGFFRMKIIHDCLNIIEDAAIELAGTNYYTGSFKQAIIANNKNALENMPSLDEMAKQKAPRLSIFLQACAMYCILGTLKGKLQDPELLKLFQQAMPILEQGRLAPDTWGRFEAAEKLYALMEPLIQEAEQLNQETEVQNSFKYTKNEKISAGQGTPQPMPNIQQDFQQKQRQKTKEEIEKQIKKGSAGNEDDEQTGDSSLEQTRANNEQDHCSENSKDEQANEEIKNGRTEEAEDEEKSEDDEETTEGGAEEDNSGDEQKEDQDSGSDEEDASNDAEEDSKEMEELLKQLQTQLEEVKDEAAYEEYNRQEQLKRDREIQEFARSVRYDDLHKHISVKIERKFVVDDAVRKQYETEFQQIKNLARNLTKNLQDLIKFNEDAKLSGLYSGRVNKSQLYRVDKRIFFQRKRKSEEADLAVLMLVDQSGSMCGSRIHYARLACMMMYEVCSALRIPFAVIGHEAMWGRNVVVHRHFVDFDSLDPDEKYKLALLNADDNTREGVSLKYAGEYLLRRPEQDKILIAISDGEPYHFSANGEYSGELAQKDTARVVKYLEVNGIKVFGVAIGDEKSSIKKIYTHNFIDIPSVQLLPQRLVELIRRNLFK